MYHRVDLTAFEADGSIQPACRVSAHDAAGPWALRQEAALTGIWSQCSFQPCFGGAASNLPRSPKKQSTESVDGYDRAAIAALARSQNGAGKPTGGESNDE